MGYCKKSIIRNAVVRALIPLFIFIFLITFAYRLPETDRQLNEVYVQQAKELGRDTVLTHADSSQVMIWCYGASGLFLLMALISLSKIIFPARSAMAKSILRYEKYEGEGNLNELMQEVDEDIAHAPTFGTIHIGKEWITGLVGISGGEAVRLERLRAVFCLKMVRRVRGSSGAIKTSRQYGLVLIDNKLVNTTYNTPKESQAEGAYHMLLRHNGSLVHGDYHDYKQFLTQSEEEWEQAFRNIERENDAKKYILK